MFANACSEVKVLSHEPMCPGGIMWRLTVENPGWQSWRPGQFVMLKSARFGPDVLWGRPISIAWADEQGVEMYYMVVGRGTAALAEVQVGETMKMWGPLGNFFSVKPDLDTLILAGGIGIPPFIGYVRKHEKPENIRMLFGHTGPFECYPTDEFNFKVDFESFYQKGPEDLQPFIELLAERISETPPDGMVLACGPLPFLKTIAKTAQKEQVKAQLSLESRMGCGVGACLGCVVSPADDGPPLTVCSRGPVFWADEIDLDKDRKY